jgi:hypothetical protein
LCCLEFFNILPFSHLDDDEFQLVLYELNNGPINFDIDRLNTMIFNPLLSGCHKSLALSTDLDPDSNFYTNKFKCDYYTEQKFKVPMS